MQIFTFNSAPKTKFRFFGRFEIRRFSSLSLSLRLIQPKLHAFSLAGEHPMREEAFSWLSRSSLDISTATATG